MIKVTVETLQSPEGAESCMVKVEGFSAPLHSARMSEAAAVALKREIEASVFDAKHSLMILEVINYGMLGRSLEARMQNGEHVMLAIPESQQAKVRDFLVKDRDDAPKPTAYDRLLKEDDEIA